MDENVIQAEPIEVTKLSKLEILSLYNQTVTTIRHQEQRIAELEESVTRASEEYGKATNEFNQYADRVSRIIKEQTRHYTTRIQTLFSMVQNMQTLLEEPHYNEVANEKPEGGQ
jgi:molecular chaperone GrpE (heat shock protein)